MPGVRRTHLVTSDAERLGTAWVARAALDDMKGEADRVTPRETGGVLLGYWSRQPTGEDAGEVVIAAVIGPGPGAVHQRWAFVPDHEHQESEIERVYEESGRCWTYLGDWHTHPDGPSRLSDKDRVTLRRIASAVDARAPNPVMLLLAGGQPWQACAWTGLVGLPRRWRRPSLQTLPLRICLFER